MGKKDHVGVAPSADVAPPEATTLPLAGRENGTIVAPPTGAPPIAVPG